MPIREYATISLEQLPAFFEELNEVLQKEVLTEIIRGSRLTLIRKARGLARERLPSGGGSYPRTIRWRDEPRGMADHTLHGSVYSNHQWAEAIEYGTRPHDIPTGGSTPMWIEDVLPAGTGATDWVRYNQTGIYRRKVRHPGARAFNIFRDALIHMTRRWRGIMNRALRRAGFG